MERLHPNCAYWNRARTPVSLRAPKCPHTPTQRTHSGTTCMQCSDPHITRLATLMPVASTLTTEALKAAVSAEVHLQRFEDEAVLVETDSEVEEVGQWG